MKSKKPILKKILIVFVSFFGIIGLLLGGFFLKSNIFSNNYSGKNLEKHIKMENDGNQTPLKAVGKGLYDKNGDLVTLKGINFGNWLIQEGWLSTTSLGYLKDDKGNPKEVNENGIITGYEEVYQEELIEALKNNKTFVVRTAWVFGINGNNFIKTMLKLSLNHDMVSVVDDQFGSPTYTVDLSRLLVDMADTEKYGIYHATNEGFCSWAEFAQYILNDTNTEVKYVSTEDYYKPQYERALNEGRELHIAYRPRNSKLSKEKLIENGFSKLPEWKDAVDRYKVELKKVRSENR